MSLPPWAMVLMTGALSQVLKFLLYGVANRELSLRVLVTTNGLPSLYAVTFGCLTTLVLLDQGYKSPMFVASFIFSGIILHDSVRLQGSMDRGGRAALLVAETMAPAPTRTRWLDLLRPLLGDRRHRPLHIAVGLVLGALAAFAWLPLAG